MRRRAAGEDGWDGEILRLLFSMRGNPAVYTGDDRHGDCPEPMKGRMADYRCSVRSMPMASFAVRDGT